MNHRSLYIICLSGALISMETQLMADEIITTSPKLIKIAATSPSVKTAPTKTVSKNKTSTTNQPSNKMPLTKAPIHIEEFTAQNNQLIWFVPNPELDLVTVGFSFQYSGHQSDPENKPGLTDFMVTMLGEGAGPYDSQAFKKILLEKNIQLSIQSNQDHITVVFRTISANINEAFRLVKLALTQPSFIGEAHTRVRQQISASLMQSLHRPEQIAHDKLKSSIFGSDHPYAKNTKKSLDCLSTITNTDLAEHLRKTITRANVKIAVAGNTTEAEIKQNIDDLMSALPNGHEKQQNSNGQLHAIGKTIIEEMDVPQTVVMFAHPGLKRSDPDFYAAFLLINALGGHFESRLWNEIREKRGLAYSINLSLFSHRLKYGMMGATATKTESVEQVLQLIRSQWEDVAQNGITQDELELQRQYVIGSYPLSFIETPDVVKILLAYQGEGFPKTYLNDRIDYFKNVTLADIKRVAKRLLKSDQLTFVVVGKKV